jgi:hypothetical protein
MVVVENICSEPRIGAQKMPIAGTLHQEALRRAEELSDDVLAAIERTF